MRIEIYKDPGNRWRWRLVEPGVPDPIATSAADWSTKEGAHTGAEYFKKLAGKAQIVVASTKGTTTDA